MSRGYRPLGDPALSMFRDRQWHEVPVRPDDWSASVQASVEAYLEAVTAGRRQRPRATLASVPITSGSRELSRDPLRLG